MIDAEWRLGNVFGAFVDMGGRCPRVIDIVSNPIEFYILELESLPYSILEQQTPSPPPTLHKDPLTDHRPGDSSLLTHPPT